MKECRRQGWADAFTDSLVDLKHEQRGTVHVRYRDIMADKFAEHEAISGLMGVEWTVEEERERERERGSKRQKRRQDGMDKRRQRSWTCVSVWRYKHQRTETPRLHEDLTTRDMRPNHTTTRLVLWSVSPWRPTRSHPCVPAGHPQYTGALHDGKAVDGPIPPQPIRKPTAHCNMVAEQV